MTHRGAITILQAEIDTLLESGLVSESNSKIKARRLAVKALEAMKQTYTIKVGGEPLKCDCGGKLFTKSGRMRDGAIYVCTCCGVAHFGEPLKPQSTDGGEQ